MLLPFRSIMSQVQFSTYDHKSRSYGNQTGYLSQTCILINNIPTVLHVKSQLQSYLYELGDFGCFDIIMSKLKSCHPFTYAIVIYCNRDQHTTILNAIKDNPRFFGSYLRPTLINDKKVCKKS